jgi:hypothetical protein
VWIDTLVGKIRTDGIDRRRPAYLVLGLNMEGAESAPTYEHHDPPHLHN